MTLIKMIKLKLILRKEIIKKKVDANFKTENLKINIDEFSKFVSFYNELLKNRISS